MRKQLGTSLFDYINKKLPSGNAAANHHYYAEKAEDYLEEIIINEMDRMGKTKDTMRFFIPFTYEIFDHYGRILGFVHTDDRETRSPSYNSLMLKSGNSLLYFIWPNINPFRKEKSIEPISKLKEFWKWHVKKN